MDKPTDDIALLKDKPIVLYALPEEAVTPDGPRRALVFDGIEAGSLAAAPADLGRAAEGGWEPSTWLIALEPDEMKRWPVLDEVDEETWLTICFVLTMDDSEGESGAYLYPPSGGNGPRYTLRLRSVERLNDRRALRRLDGFARLKGIPQASRQTITAIFSDALAPVREPAVVAYDVGQANWNAVVDVGNCPDRPPVPVLFFDCGAPSGWNYHTRPTSVIDPFANASLAAPVVLSHWDMDHWAGAAPDQPLYGGRGIVLRWSPTALDRIWIVPNQGRNSTGQKIRSTAWRLALALHKTNKLVVWPTLLNRISLPQGSCIVKCVPAPRVRGKNNNSGLAMIVQTHSSRRPDALTILPGDADYASLAINYPELYQPGMSFTGLIASHHGADLVGSPPQALVGWSRLAVSHGRCHGHPTPGALAAHKAAGWGYQYETHVRHQRLLSNGTQQEGGSVVLGATMLASAAARGRCRTCPAASNACPIQ